MHEKVGEKAVILGGGLVGLEIGIFLGQLGHKVAILELQDDFTVENRSLHTFAL